MSKSFKELFTAAKKRDSYWVEHAILEFTSELYLLMKSKGVTKSELASLLGTSPAYITKVFSGNANFTIETMVKLTRALGGKFHTHVSRDKSTVFWFDLIDGEKPNSEAVAWGQPEAEGFHRRIRVHG